MYPNTSSFEFVSMFILHGSVCISSWNMKELLKRNIRYEVISMITSLETLRHLEIQ